MDVQRLHTRFNGVVIYTCCMKMLVEPDVQYNISTVISLSTWLIRSPLHASVVSCNSNIYLNGYKRSQIRKGCRICNQRTASRWKFELLRRVSLNGVSINNTTHSCNSSASKFGLKCSEALSEGFNSTI